MWSREVKILQILQSSQISNKNVIQGVTAFKHGNSHYILFDTVGECNLNDLLHGKSPMFVTRTETFTPGSLFRQALHLLNGLTSLHEGIYTAEGHYVILHMDLKPENVVVVRNSNAPLTGSWIIIDYGISKLQIREPGRSSSPTRPRCSGPYQPPEVESTDRVYTEKSDIWSFGCILALILTFTVKGPNGVKELDLARQGRGTEDRFYIHKNSEVTLNPKVKRVLDDLESPLFWVTSCRDLIYRILQPVASSRPETNVVRDCLGLILERLKNTPNEDTCSWDVLNPQSNDPSPPMSLLASAQAWSPQPLFKIPPTHDSRVEPIESPFGKRRTRESIISSTGDCIAFYSNSGEVKIVPLSPPSVVESQFQQPVATEQNITHHPNGNTWFARLKVANGQQQVSLGALKLRRRRFN